MPLFAGADADALRKIENEDLAVADISRPCALYYCIYRRFYKLIVDCNLNANLFDKVDFDDTAAVTLGVPRLLPAPDYIGNRHFTYFCIEKCLLDIGQLCRLYNRHNHFHCINSLKNGSLSVFGGKDLETAVCFHAMFTNVKTCYLFLTFYPESNGYFDKGEKKHGTAKGPYKNRTDTG